MPNPGLQTGVSLGGYRLGEVLGEGGLGTVYATRGPAGEPLAIKIVAHGGDAALQVRVAREVEALRRIDHPNVLGLADAGIDATWSYIVMPRLEGTTLRELVQAGPPLAPESAALLVMHAARGAGALHRAGLCHRDLKPDNIMLTDDGRVVIIDLGLALATDWTRQTSEGSIAGSLPYMAPEQIEGDADPRSDVWSLGVTWWELVTGARPFARARALEEVAAIAAGARPAIAEVDRRCDEAAAALLERCLAHDPAGRPADGDALADALAALVELDAGSIVRLRRDRAAHEAELAERAARRCAELARARSDAGDVFGAMRAIDRGLAYRPGDPALEQQLAAAIPATPAPAPPRSTGGRRRLARRVGLASAGVAALAAGAAFALQAGPQAPPHRDLREPRAVVDTILDAVRADDPASLPGLCVADSSDAARRICAARPGEPDWAKLRTRYLDATIEGSYRTERGAVISLRLGDGRHDTLELVRRDGRFYLGDPR